LVAGSVADLGLQHAVITSVTRDDLPDGGAHVFAATIRAIRERSPETTVEVLIPDFCGSEAALALVLDAMPDVINHNLETVPRLYPLLRQQASYERSLILLRRVRDIQPRVFSKSGIMVGVGETRDEVVGVVNDLAEAGCSVLTIGQYLRPSARNHPVHRYVPPEEFEDLRKTALASGISRVAAGPLVRSSYKAGEIIADLKGSVPPVGEACPSTPMR